MHVVTAGMHHAIDPARVRKPGRLPDRQGIHVRTQQHRRPVAVAEHPGDPGPRDALDHLKAQIPQPARRDPRRAMLLKRQLWMSMQIPVDLTKAAGQLVSHGTQPKQTGRAGSSPPGPSMS